MKNSKRKSKDQLRTASGDKSTESFYRPLHGMRVLDLSNVAGGYCTKLLADMGADVIKIEPIGGDDTRRIGPFSGDDPNIEKSLVFTSYNTNKRSLSLNLESPDGKSLFKSLIKDADVLVETYAPGYMDSLKLGYKNLRRLNKQLIMTSITPFGQDGPYKDYPGTELTLLAIGGVTFLCGEKDGLPCTAPGFMAYDVAGTYAAIGIMLCLHNRFFSGQGQYQDVSVQESVACVADWCGPRYQEDGIFLERTGSVEEVYWPSGLYKCKDGYIMCFPLTPDQWTALVKWIGGHDELLEPFWMLMANRTQNHDLLRTIFEEFFAKFEKHDLCDKGQAKGIPCTPLNSMFDFIGDKHEQARDYFHTIRHKIIGAHIAPRAPYLVNGFKISVPRPAPILGQDSVDILTKELSLSMDEVIALKGNGSI